VQFTTRETGAGLLSSQFDILSNKTGFTVSSYWMGGPVTYVSRARLLAEWENLEACIDRNTTGAAHIGHYKRSFDSPHGIFSERSITAFNLTATCSGTEVTWATTKGLRHSSKR